MLKYLRCLLLLYYQCVIEFGEGEYEPLVEPGLDLVELVGPVARVNVHAQTVELFETVQSFYEHYYQSASLDSLDGPAQDVRSQTLEVLQNKQVVSVTQNLVALFVVTVSHVR